LSFSAAALHAVLEASVPAEASGLVVALSGGPDSAALLAAAAALGKAKKKNHATLKIKIQTKK